MDVAGRDVFLLLANRLAKSKTGIES